MLELYSERNTTEGQINKSGKHTETSAAQLSHGVNKVCAGTLWLSVALNIQIGRSFEKTLKLLISNKSHCSGSDIVMLEKGDVINEQAQVCNILNQYDTRQYK